MNEAEKRMYVMSAKNILEDVKESLTYKLSGPGMVIASYLSDAQELIAVNDSERARQYITLQKCC